MTRAIRYAHTEDDVRIAYTEFGGGEPIVFLPALPWAQFSVCLGNPLTSAHPQELGEFARVVMYDARGCGQSDREVLDLTLDGFARDIDAVADAAGIETFTLYASADAAATVIHYAATRPERVSNLLLWIPSVGPARLRSDPVVRAMRPLVESDWEIYIRTISHAVVGGWDAKRAPYAAAWADIMRASIHPAEYLPFMRAIRDHAVEDELARVQAPTLVMTREDAALYTVPVVREVAAGIPGAKFVVLPGSWLLPCTDDEVTRAIEVFLAERAPAGRRSSAAAGNGTRPAPPPRGAATVRLSAREREVLALIAEGKTNAEIAEALVVAPSTASRHVHNILGKLGMSRRAEAAAYAAVEGLLRREA